AERTRRNTRIIRAVTAAIAVALLLLAVFEARALHGGTVIGWTQWALLVLALGVGAFCFAPIAWNQNALLVLAAVGVSLVMAEFVLRATVRPWFETIYQAD